jgi:uncharacterized cupin superfamily protein
MARAKPPIAKLTAKKPTTGSSPVELKRPPFIIAASSVPETSSSYPRSEEKLAAKRAIGRKAGLLAIGLHLQRMAPGTRTSWPHAEELEEEFAYVISGEVDCWVDGNLHRMRAGDLAAFPAGTGICHSFINNSDGETLLLVGGEANKSANRIVYPLNPDRATDMPWSHYWHNAPLRLMGPDDGLPRAMKPEARRKAATERKKAIAMVTGKPVAGRRKTPRAAVTVKVKTARKSQRKRTTAAGTMI